MHPDTELQFISEDIGYGVVATRFIPMGTITWVQDELDQVYTPREVEAMAPRLKEMVDKYTFRNKDGNYVMCWDLAKYVNHSFNSNCLSTAYDFEIAVRDIQPGEQLTDDYGYLNITEPFEAKDEGLERSTVYPDDLLRYHEEWDAKIETAFKNFYQLDQPLMELVPREHQQLLKDRLSRGEPLDSILNLFYEG